MKILCGTDFSLPAMEAAELAANLAMRAQQTLLLAHVAEPPPRPIPGDSPGTESPPPVQERLQQEAERLRQRGAQVQEFLLQGTPTKALASFALSSGAQLIVLASHGQRPPTRWQPGSTAERTAQTCPAPTWLVRPAGQTQSPPFDQRNPKLVVGIDFTAASDAALNWIRNLAQFLPCDVVAVYVSWPPSERERFGVPIPEPPTENPIEVRTALERDLKQRLDSLTGPGERRVRIEVGRDRKETRLIEVAIEEHADLLVVGTHQRHGFDRLWQGSVSRGILHHAPMSVVCVPVVEDPHLALSPVPRVRRVLVPTDFSWPGNLAIAHACSLVDAGGLVKVVHVIHPRALPDGEYSQGLTQDPRHEQLAREHRRRLLALHPPDAAARGIKTEVEVIDGEEPAKAICQAARRIGADVICMAARGESSPSKTGLGSVLQGVVDQTRRPVLVVRPPRP